MNVKLGNGDAVHAAATQVWDGEIHVVGAKCNRNYNGARRLRVRTTDAPITCRKCSA